VRKLEKERKKEWERKEHSEIMKSWRNKIKQMKKETKN
jgi:hypothetical protein